MSADDNDLLEEDDFGDESLGDNEIEGLGDSNKKNNVFFFGMLILLVGAVLIIAVGTSEEEVAKEIDAQVDEEYITSNARSLDLPPPGAAPDKLVLPERRGLLRRTPPPEAPKALPPIKDNRAELAARARLEEERRERRSANSVVFNSSDSLGGDGGDSVNDRLLQTIDRVGANSGGASVSGFGGNADGSGSAFGDSLDIEASEGVAAQILEDSTFILAEGNLLGCVLETAISTDLPGKTRCILSEDAYSYDGRARLLQKGTRVIGEYQGGLQAGVKRIFVIWTRAITPDGIDIRLNSGSTDSLGRSGAGVFVDSHFFERFGASTLLSLIGAAAAGSGDDDRLEAGGENFNESASIALENSINIEPTGYKSQGDKIRIFVARDIDFKNALVLRKEERERG